MQNLRFALRTLAKSPGFAVTAILTLAVGIGASTAIFTTVDAVLLHPLPYPNAAQLVLVTKNMPKFELFKSDASALDFYRLPGPEPLILPNGGDAEQQR
jgi:hypothetical protein